MRTGPGNHTWSRGRSAGAASRPERRSGGQSVVSPTFEAACAVASAVLLAVFLAEVAVALALLFAGLLRAVFLAVDADFFAVLVACVRVVLALAVVVCAAVVASCVAGWRRMRPTRVSPRRTKPS